MNYMTRTFALVSLLLTAAAIASGHASGGVGASTQTARENQAQPHTLALGLSGYSPVSYIEEGRAEPGSPRYAAEHAGITYFFVSDRQRRAFLTEPDRYLPAYGGYCAFGCSVDSRFVPDPTNFEVIDERTHLFLKNDELDARILWREAPRDEVRDKADRFWAAQSESRAYVNGRNVPASGIGLDGYSPASYFTSGRPEQGDPRFSVTHNGVTYHLTSAEQVRLFKRNPARYEPQCGGWCAFGMSVQDKFPVDPTKYKIIDGKLYLFLNNEQVDALSLWQEGDEAELLQNARSHWRKVSGD